MGEVVKVVVGLVALFLAITVVGGLAGWWDKDEPAAADTEVATATPDAAAEGKLKLSADELRGAIERKARAFVAATGHELGELEVTVNERSAKAVARLAAPTPPMSRRENEKIVHALVKLVLEALIEAGHDPHEEWIYVSGYAYQPMERKSPTGRALVRTHAAASYDYSRDAIEVKEYRP